MAEQIKDDARTDVTTASFVEEGLKLCKRYGLHPALLFMEQVGVPRMVALRVLCSPNHYRQRDRRRMPRPARSCVAYAAGMDAARTDAVPERPASITCADVGAARERRLHR